MLCDRVSTKKSALNKVTAQHVNAQPVPIYCVTHNLSNAGKLVVQYKEGARTHAAKTFGEPLKFAKGARFFVHIEQLN